MKRDLKKGSRTPQAKCFSSCIYLKKHLFAAIIHEFDILHCSSTFQTLFSLLLFPTSDLCNESYPSQFLTQP
eukprot:UN01375